VAEIRASYPQATVKLVKSAGGAFEVSVDGQLVFSKLRLGRHAKPGEIIGLMRKREALPEEPR
jgi:selT/selW/selH-like putative selenoprotein